jgi:hypothetical protein
MVTSHNIRGRRPQLQSQPPSGKVLFFRFDPSLTGGGPALPQAVAQVVMPMPAMVQTAAFINAAIENLVGQGQVSEVEWKTAKDTALASFKFNAV